MFKFLIKKKHLKQHDNQEFKISIFFRSVDLMTRIALMAI